MSEISDAILSMATSGPGPILAWGEVISVSPTEVRFAGDSSEVEVSTKLSSYTPTTNDIVVVLKVGTAWVIIGDIG
jgi:hypothetical protein